MFHGPQSGAWSVTVLPSANLVLENIGIPSMSMMIIGHSLLNCCMMFIDLLDDDVQQEQDQNTIQDQN